MRRFFVTIGLVSFVFLLGLSHWAYESTAKISINTADRQALIQLPGVGEVLADRIIENRPIQSWEELAEISGFGEQRIRSLEGSVRIP